jgi:hypothetical protein
MLDNDQLPSTLGGLVRESIEVLAKFISVQNPEYTVITTTEAVELLNRLGMIDLTKQRKHRNYKTLVDSLASESIELEKPASIVSPTPKAVQDLAQRIDTLIQEPEPGLGKIAGSPKEILANLRKGKGGL